MSAQGPIISVEDDEDDQHLIQTVIETLQLSNELRFFHHGQEALEYLSTTTEKPLLILCDINMPVMNGLELRQRINENEFLRQKSIPFIFLTTAASEEVIQIAYEQTVQGFFQKESSFEAFREQVRLIIAYWKYCLHPNSNR